MLKFKFQMAQLDAKVLEIQHERDRLQQQAQDQVRQPH
jgi:hypothetical protein